MDHIGRCGWGLKIYAYLQIFENKHYLKEYCSNFCDKLKYNFSEYFVIIIIITTKQN